MIHVEAWRQTCSHGVAPGGSWSVDVVLASSSEDAA